MRSSYSNENKDVITPELLFDERIRSEKVHLTLGCFGSSTCAVAYYFYSIENNDSPYALWWMLSHIMVSLNWLLFVFAYNRGVPQARKAWTSVSIFTSASFAVAWSASWFLFVDSNSVQPFIIWIVIIYMVLAGGVFSLVFHLLSQSLFLALIFLPIIIDLYINETAYEGWLFRLMVITYVAAIIFGFAVNRFILDAFARREENIRLAQQLKIEKQHVELASQEKTRFLAAASHDLRQPIQAIRLFEHILETRLDKQEDKELLQKLHNSTDSLASLLDSLLDISKLDADIIKINKHVFCIDDVLSQIYEEYYPIAAEEGIQLRYVVSRVHVESDHQQLERIIRNLVVNAIKHMGKKGKIVLGVRRYDAKIVVMDNGVGIPEAEQNKIFREFYQLNNPERNRTKGLGLGLAIVNRTATLLGHTLAVSSTLEKGCQFTIQVPIVRANKKAVPLVEQSKDVERYHSKSILVIEDDQEVLQALNTLLTSWGCQTFLASNKADAICIGKANDIQAIVSDYQLQNDDNGVEVILALREYYQNNLPAIVLTGNTSPAVLKELSAYQIPILNKPFSPAQLLKEFDKLF